jgi:hypothetical protein
MRRVWTEVSIRTRLAIGLSVVACGAVAVGLTGSRGLGQVATAASSLAEATRTLTDAVDARNAVLQARRYERDFIIAAGDLRAQAACAEKWREARKALEAALETLRADGLGGVDADSAARGREGLARYAAGVEAMFDAGRNPTLGAAELNRLVAPVNEEIERVNDLLDEASANLDEQTRANAAHAQAELWLTRKVLYSVLLLVILAAVAVGWVVARSVRRATSTLAEQATRLTAAVNRGDLWYRGSPELVLPEFRGVIEGMNRTVEAFAVPIRINLENVTAMAEGRVPSKVEAELHGEFEVTKTGWNGLIEVIGQRNEDTARLHRAALEGDLDVRIDTSRYTGYNGKLLDNINQMLDALTGPLRTSAEHLARIARGDVPARITGEYRGEFARIIDNLNTCIDAVNALVADAGRLAEAGAQGQLSVRADASRHPGDFRKIVDGFNRSLDAVVTPSNPVE